MYKSRHEFRDPIHNFVYLTTQERNIVDSEPFQRLRYISQLATTYLIYPGTTHKRFEHSLGVMDLATKVFDIITDDANCEMEAVRELIKPVKNDMEYWRKVLRMAALCHDLGHLPFSHASEELLPKGSNHEQITMNIILGEPINNILLNELHIQPQHVAKIAVKPKDFKKLHGDPTESVYSNFEAILSEIITGDAFGVDRIDYLLRDSYYAGVAYGKFDYHRLIDTIRILPSISEKDDGKNYELTLGIDEGGLHSAEALSLARYYMFSQLYLHPIRRIYDIHLMDFLKEWLPNHQFNTMLPNFFKTTDNEVLAAMRDALGRNTPLDMFAQRIVHRRHFKKVYQATNKDMEINVDSIKCIYDAACEKFGADHLRYDHYSKETEIKFPVSHDDDIITSSCELSHILSRKDNTRLQTNYVFIESSLRDQFNSWLSANKNDILKIRRNEGD